MWGETIWAGRGKAIRVLKWVEHARRCRGCRLIVGGDRREGGSCVIVGREVSGSVGGEGVGGCGH